MSNKYPGHSGLTRCISKNFLLNSATVYARAAAPIKDVSRLDLNLDFMFLQRWTVHAAC